MRKCLVASAIVLGALTAAAHAEQDKPRLEATAANTAEKARFVSNLLTRSASSRALASNTESKSQETLETARQLLAEARTLLEGGDVAAADGKLNKAISLVMGETQRVSSDRVGEARAEEVFATRRASVTALTDALVRVAEEKNRSRDALETQEAIQQLLSEADALAAQKRFKPALALVDQAYNRVSGEVAALRDGDKLVKELHFADAKDEYIYEVDRNDSHIFLLKLTLAEDKAHPSFLPKIEELRSQAMALREQAEASADRSDYEAGIAKLGESTTLLIKALRMGGAYIPG